jgi:hypothetical protein
MGYDNDECVFCYCNGGGNESDCSKNIICLTCMEEIVDDWTTYRLKAGLKEFLNISDTPEICRMCNKDAYLYFEAPICEEHLKYDFDKNVYNEGYSEYWVCGNIDCGQGIHEDFMVNEKGEQISVDKYKCDSCDCIRWKPEDY